MSKDKITREEAEAHDAEVRELLKPILAATDDLHTVMLSLGYALPEKPLTSAAKKQLEKRADKIVRSALINHLHIVSDDRTIRSAVIEYCRRSGGGGDAEFEMLRLARCWLEQQGRGRGRPSKSIQKLAVQQAVWDEYRKHEAPDPKIQRALDDIGKRTGFRITHVPKRPMHKQIIGDVGDRIGVGRERMKQLAPRGPDPVAEIDKAIKRIAKKPRRK